MKLISLVAAMLFFIASSQCQNVGIGTTTPSANAILDISSPDKGVMLPRLADTSNVANPSAGLIIYNEHAKAPSFHNGVQWNSLAIASSLLSADSIKYTINGGAEYGALSYNQSGYRDVDAVGRPSSATKASQFSITKVFDGNSFFFKDKLYNDPFPTITMEITFYQQDASTPFYKVRFENVYVIGVNDVSTPAEGLREIINFTAKKIIFTDLGTGTSTEFTNVWPVQ
jgi:type VI protein secretion system component Hcp